MQQWTQRSDAAPKIILIQKTLSLCEKCPNTEFFLVRIFLYSVRIWKSKDQKKLCIWELYTQCNYLLVRVFSNEKSLNKVEFTHDKV